MIRSCSLVSLACCVGLAVVGSAPAAFAEGVINAPAEELSPRVAEPFSLAIRSLSWDGDPHAMPFGVAVLAADGQTVWEVAGVTRAAASEDGSTVALLTRDYHLLVSRLPESPRRVGADQYLIPRLSRDGALLLAQKLGAGGHILEKALNTKGIALFNLETGEERLVVEGSDVYAPSFASDDRIFFGSGGKDHVASLYLLDLNAALVARVTNRETGARQTFPSATPRIAGVDVIYDADGEHYRVPLPGQSDFGPLQRFEAPLPADADFTFEPDFGTVRLRRPNVQVGQPKVFMYYDVDRRQGKIKDWACFQKTYDQHRGTDFNQAYGLNVVAPAWGVVIFRYDGCNDNNSQGCAWGMGNHVAMKHADGTVSLLCHGKKWTVVDFGSYACGSVVMQSAKSGNANVYHIHHETWLNSSDKYKSPRFDPFQGSCDPSDPSKWSDQNAYNDLPGTTCTN